MDKDDQMNDSKGLRRTLPITTAGDVSVAMRAADSWSPTGIAVSGDDVYVLEFLYIDLEQARDWLPHVRKLSKSGGVETIVEVHDSSE